MPSKDEKNLQQVIDKISGMGEPARSTMRRVHDVITGAAPTLKPRIWCGVPACAESASAPAIITLRITLRIDERLDLAITERAAFRAAGGADGQLTPAA